MRAQVIRGEGLPPAALTVDHIAYRGPQTGPLTHATGRATPREDREDPERERNSRQGPPPPSGVRTRWAINAAGRRQLAHLNTLAQVGGNTKVDRERERERRAARRCARPGSRSARPHDGSQH